MPIPDYQTLMLPLLRLAGDGAERPFREAVEKLADEFALTEDQRAELLPSGTAHIFGNRVGWARSYLKQAGLLEAPKSGIFRITPEGKTLIASIAAGNERFARWCSAHAGKSDVPQVLARSNSTVSAFQNALQNLESPSAENRHGLARRSILE